MSIDGYQVILADKLSNNFILSQLNPNETHTIIIYTLTDSGTNTARTLNATPTNQENAIGLILPWILFIFAVIFCGIGLYGVPFASLIGSVIALIGLVNNTTNGSFIIDILYICIVIAGILLVRGET